MASLEWGQVVVAVSGSALFISLWFAWYRANDAIGYFTVSGWRALSFEDVLLAVLAVLACGWALLPASRVAHARYVWLGCLVAAGGVVAFGVTLFRFIDMPDKAAGSAAVDARRVGLVLALAASVGIVLGALTVVRDGRNGPEQPD